MESVKDIIANLRDNLSGNAAQALATAEKALLELEDANQRLTARLCAARFASEDAERRAAAVGRLNTELVLKLSARRDKLCKALVRCPGNVESSYDGVFTMIDDACAKLSTSRSDAEQAIIEDTAEIRRLLLNDDSYTRDKLSSCVQDALTAKNTWKKLWQQEQSSHARASAALKEVFNDVFCGVSQLPQNYEACPAAIKTRLDSKRAEHAAAITEVSELKEKLRQFERTINDFHADQTEASGRLMKLHSEHVGKVVNRLSPGPGPLKYVVAVMETDIAEMHNICDSAGQQWKTKYEEHKLALDTVLDAVFAKGCRPNVYTVEEVAAKAAQLINLNHDTQAMALANLERSKATLSNYETSIKQVWNAYVGISDRATMSPAWMCADLVSKMSAANALQGSGMDAAKALRDRLNLRVDPSAINAFISEVNDKVAYRDAEMEHLLDAFGKLYAAVARQPGYTRHPAWIAENGFNNIKDSFHTLTQRVYDAERKDKEVPDEMMQVCHYVYNLLPQRPTLYPDSRAKAADLIITGIQAIIADKNMAIDSLRISSAPEPLPILKLLELGELVGIPSTGKDGSRSPEAYLDVILAAVRNSKDRKAYFANGLLHEIVTEYQKTHVVSAKQSRLDTLIETAAKVKKPFSTTYAYLTDEDRKAIVGALCSSLLASVDSSDAVAEAVVAAVNTANSRL